MRLPMLWKAAGWLAERLPPRRVSRSLAGGCSHAGGVMVYAAWGRCGAGNKATTIVHPGRTEVPAIVNPLVGTDALLPHRG
jgi:hypothetical protein